MRRALLLVALCLAAAPAAAQEIGGEPVFAVRLQADRAPLVAGDEARLAVVLSVDRGWHVNSNAPGDEFMVPTTLAWTLPAGWAAPTVTFPPGREVRFEFSEQPLEVWDGQVVVIGRVQVPESARGPADLRVEVTAQACNDRQCLPPQAVGAAARVEVAAVGSASRPLDPELFAAVAPAPGPAEGGSGRLAGMPLPLLLLFVFVAGLGLNLTPCVYPLIPITISIFAREGRERTGSSFGLAVAYVLGMAATYSALGVAAALTGRLFGAALQSPWVVVLVVLLLLALAASMFGFWELRPPAWALRASGGRAGYAGALLMGLVVGFVAAPCVGPFVVGLLTFVGERGDPWLGFAVFFTLAVGLGLPYLLLGLFTGWIQKLPAAGGWMEGVRKVFGVVLVALAAHFAAPLLPGRLGAQLFGLVLTVGGLFLLLVERTGHQHPIVDRVMRAVCAVMIVVGTGTVGGGLLLTGSPGGRSAAQLEWDPYERDAVAAAVASGQPVILDFSADWCVPCKELDARTFSDPRVVQALAGYARFKSDQTKATGAATAAAAAYRVSGVPTIIVIRGGQEISRLTGFEPPEQFLKRLAGT